MPISVQFSARAVPIGDNLWVGQWFRLVGFLKEHVKYGINVCIYIQTQDKQEQLNEALVEYSRNGLPKIPGLLTLGRPHYCPSAFQLEGHWTDIVDKHETLSKRQRDQQEAIWELLTTEVEYIRKLRAVIDVSLVSVAYGTPLNLLS